MDKPKPTHLVAHLYFFQSHKAKQKIQKSYQANTPQNDRNNNHKKGYAYNKGFARERAKYLV